MRFTAEDVGVEKADSADFSAVSFEWNTAASIARFTPLDGEFYLQQPFRSSVFRDSRAGPSIAFSI